MMRNVSSGWYYDCFKCSGIHNRTAAHNPYSAHLSQPNKSSALVVYSNFIGTFCRRYKKKAVMTHNARARNHLSEWWNFLVPNVANVAPIDDIFIYMYFDYRVPKWCNIAFRIPAIELNRIEPNRIASNKRINCRILLLFRL